MHLYLRIRCYLLHYRFFFMFAPGPRMPPHVFALRFLMPSRLLAQFA